MGVSAMATDYTKDPRWRWTVDPSKHQRLRDVRGAVAKAAGMSVEDALWNVRESHRLGEETEGTKALSKAFQSSEYRDLTMNSAGERSDIGVRNVFDESSWGFIKQNRWFSQLVTAGLTAAVGGAAFAGVGAGGAAASGAGGAGGAAAGGASSAVSLGSVSGELAGLSVSSGTAAGISAGSQAGAYLGVSAGGAAGAAAAAPSFSNAWQVGGSGGAGAGSASSLLTADNAVKGLKAASGLLGAAGAGGDGGVAGADGPPRIQPPPVAPIAPGNILRPASPSIVRAAKTAQRRAAPQGRASTILTSGRGLLTKPTLGRKMLLGQ